MGQAVNKIEGKITNYKVLTETISDSKIEKEETKLPDRPACVHGATYKVKLDHLPNAFYISINHLEYNGRLIPYELFINTLDPNYLSWAGIVSRLVSAIFRNGGDISFVSKELKQIFEAESFFYKGKKYFSLAEIIGEIIERHCKSIGYA